MESEILGILKDAYEHAYEVIGRAIAFINKKLALFNG